MQVPEHTNTEAIAFANCLLILFLVFAWLIIHLPGSVHNNFLGFPGYSQFISPSVQDNGHRPGGQPQVLRYLFYLHTSCIFRHLLQLHLHFFIVTVQYPSQLPFIFTTCP